MKRTHLLHILSLSLLFMTSCGSKEDMQDRQFISFVTQTKEVASRASFINSTNDLHHFIVWGDYDGKAVFTGQHIVKNDGVWEYSPQQKWILSATRYDFSAYAPLGAGVPNIIDNRLSSIDVDCNNNQEDLLMAYTIVPKRDIGRTVSMNFNHALAAINFSFRLKEGFSYANTYKVKSVVWDNVHTEGRFTLNNDNTITTGLTGSAGQTNTVTSFSGTAFTTSSAMTSDYLFVIPQAKADASLTISLEINGERKEIIKEIAIDWEAGKKYTYNITVDPFEIAIETTPWDTPTIEDIIIQ